MSQNDARNAKGEVATWRHSSLHAMKLKGK